VIGEVVIELGGHGLKFGELGPWDIGEVVMFDVVSDIKGEFIDGTIV